MESLAQKKEKDMTNNLNFRKPRNNNPMANGGASSMERRIRAKMEEISRKLYAKYGRDFINQLSPAALMELIRLEFGDNPIGAMLEKPDRIRDALRQLYGNPLSRWSY